MRRAQIYYDMHVHSTSSPDASLSEVSLAHRAVKEGLAGVGFVVHLDFHPSDFCYGSFDSVEYETAFRKAARETAGSLILMKGVELGEPLRFRSEITVALTESRFDFLMGALHWIEDRFLLDESAYASTDPLELVEEYLRRTLEIVENCELDILAHLGIFRRGLAKAGISTGFDETILWPVLLERILVTMIERNIALEVNTSGLRRLESVTYPNHAVLRLYRTLGGELVTTGSDTHRDPWVFNALPQAAELLLETGFTHTVRFTERERIECPLRSCRPDRTTG
jgi:histidinol-phosphatase (PHP family)